MSDDTPATCLRSIAWVLSAGVALGFFLVILVNLVQAILIARGWP